MSWKRYFTRALVLCGSIVLIGLAGTPAWSSERPRPIRFDRLSIEQGLSQASVHCVFQDSRGFMWFGTQDGLNRFDGYRFESYKHDPSNTDSLPSDFVWTIDEDPAGNLWLGTDGGGVAMWDRATDRFVRRAEVSPRFVRALRFDADGRLWIGTRREGLEILDTTTGKVRHIRHDAEDPGSLSDDRVFALFRDRDDRMWVGTDSGLNRFDASDNTFNRFVHRPADPGSLSDGRVRAIFQDDSGALWVGTYGGGLNRLDPASRTFERFRHDPDDRASLSHDRVRAIFQDDSGRLWIGTAAGLDLRRPRGGFDHYSHVPGDPASLSGEAITVISQDRGGVLWVGTRLGGLNKWNSLAWQFGHHPSDPDDAHGLASANVLGFSEDPSGNIWISTFGGGLHVMHRATGVMNRYRHNPDDDHSLGSDRVTALLHDRDGTLWAGTLDGGLNRFDPPRGTFTRFRHDPDRGDTLGHDGVMALLEDREGVLWVGTFGGGLSRFDSASGTFRNYRHDPADPASLSGNRVTSLLESGDGRLWVGTDGGGLNLFDPARERTLRLRHDSDDPRTLCSDVVYSLYRDGTGALWVGTREGLAVLPGAADAAAETGFRTFMEKDGLPNDTVYGIQPDRDGGLWLSTNRGLSRMDRTEVTFRNLDVSHGLQANEFNYGASFRSAAGELFFGGINGFNAFLPERLERNEHVPPVVMTDFLKSNRPVADLGPVDRLESIHLGYADDVVTFEFAALDFTSPNRNRYEYMLEGFDTDWIDLGNLRRVTYTDLDGGDYVLHVRAANNDGVWNRDGLAVDLQVDPPPWRSSWAYSLYFLTTLGCVFGLVRIQQRKLEREEQYTARLETEVREQTRALSARATEMEQLNDRLVQASITDALTGLANRRFLDEYLKREVDLVKRRYRALHRDDLGEEPFDLMFMMVDLDNFKTINDTCGHVAGDQVLRQLRGILETACRSSDILTRWGGDEFLVVGRDVRAKSREELAERIRTAIAGHIFELDDGRIVRTSCSIGFACYPFVHSDLSTLTWENVIGVADRALYVAKRSGRNAWVGFSGVEDVPVRGLAGAIQEVPKRLVDQDLLNVHTSLLDDNDLVWD